MSKKYSLNKADLISVGITMGIVVLSAVLGQLLELVPQFNFGTHSEVITVVLIFVLKLAQKFLTGIK